ncbi:MAG: HetP family heterocyst commitment protein [Cyanobacteria bacterium J06621_11]
MYSSQQYSTQPYQVNKPISPAQLDSIIEAILAGKYSYACLMTLEATGHDPLDYIPYRTYNRLQKQRQERGRSTHNTTEKISPINPEFSDLDYIEPAHKESTNFSGGYGYPKDSSYSNSNLLFWPAQSSLN